MAILTPEKQSIKKTLINALLYQNAQNHTPYNKIQETKGFTRNQLIYKKKTINLWDLSGETDYIGIWLNYIKKANYIIFLIDGSDHSEKNFFDIKKIFERFGKFFGENCYLYFSKNDSEDFNIIPFLDFLKGFEFFKGVRGIGEFNVLESGLRKKVLNRVLG